jgi:hypothetical protein
MHCGFRDDAVVGFVTLEERVVRFCAVLFGEAEGLDAFDETSLLESSLGEAFLWGVDLGGEAWPGDRRARVTVEKNEVERRDSL